MDHSLFAMLDHGETAAIAISHCLGKKRDSQACMVHGSVLLLVGKACCLLQPVWFSLIIARESLVLFCNLGK